VAQEGTQALKNLNKPTLAMIDGYCIVSVFKWFETEGLFS